MPTLTSSDGTRLSYEDDGSGPPVLLLHGFASSGYVNWVRPGIVDKLVAAGRRVLTMDLRGHGASDKPHEPDAYGATMCSDIQALLDVTGPADAAGYSAGAIQLLSLLGREPRLGRVALCGIGANALRPPPDTRPIAEGMLAADKTTIASPLARGFRDFADTTKADKQALAAFMSSARPEPGDLGAVTEPVLVLAASGDALATDPSALAAAIPGARAVVIQGGSHLNVINHPDFQRELVEFFGV